MKRLTLLLAGPLLGLAIQAPAQFSVGNYRIPYASGLTTTVLVDHASHTLPNRVDLKCIDTGVTQVGYWVVAAEAGVIRAIRDTGSGGCGTCTNYVWIEHDNGEWTGYFYLRVNSVTGTNGLSVGDTVNAGQVIAVEGQIGSPGGFRLRFEVGVPANPNDPIEPNTGMIKGTSRAPIICNIPDNVLRSNTTYSPRSCFAAEFSRGIYRLPYTNNVQFRVSGDHLTHSPNKTRYDLVGQGGAPAPYPIVAAASGTIRFIVDGNTVTCTTNGCSAFNNYVWIQHSNGEWTKYTHFTTGSVRNKAGLTNGQFVTAGTYLGDEGQIGAASGVHLHFEVGVPDNTNSIAAAIDIPNGGFIRGINRIPLMCGIPGNIMYDGDVLTAANCSGGGCVNDIVLPGKILRGTDAYIAGSTVDSGGNNFSIDTYGSLALYAGNKVTLRPGFKALDKSYLRAAIQPCFNPP